MGGEKGPPPFSFFMHGTKSPPHLYLLYLFASLFKDENILRGMMDTSMSSNDPFCCLLFMVTLKCNRSNDGATSDAETAAFR